MEHSEIPAINRTVAMWATDENAKLEPDHLTRAKHVQDYVCNEA